MDWTQYQQKILTGVAGGAGPDVFSFYSVDVAPWAAKGLLMPLVLGGRATTPEEARAVLEASLRSGAALEKLFEIVARQGGDTAVLRDLSRLPKASLAVAVPSPAAGFVQSMDAYEVAMAAVTLGAGRLRMDDVIDRSAGIVLEVKRGSRVARGQPLAILHGSEATRVEAARARFSGAVTIDAVRPVPRPLVRARVDAAGLHPVATIDDLAAAG